MEFGLTPKTRAPIAHKVIEMATVVKKQANAFPARICNPLIGAIFKRTRVPRTLSITKEIHFFPDV